MSEGEGNFKCLNPVGIQEPVDTYPLARRLDRLNGKRICFSASGEADIMMPLEQRLRNEYPSVIWTKKESRSTDVDPLTDEEMKTTDALIQGVAW